MTIKIKKNNAFVILFTVVISSILLSITLGITNIAVKELKFSTSAKDTNEAFFAADTGIESVLLLDKPPASICTPSPTCTSDFVVSNLGGANKSCAKVNVTKIPINIGGVEYIRTTVTSKGYNITGASCGDPSNPNLVERQIEVRY
ncbi:hypothetical protein A2814_02045 [Candidatus Nomurabacteria bacterium RIFCSPHIGHO2_01_FULL_38_19]|uniref:Type 4 fimbrial biogenesis protein PilX N-terminal domain-containing protein n=1 Tax=Candidatus Nomurabacteria bacterium RIFCSPHIGHO2_01_FULL_38_19 TaxID=1801732 RepID=A0A1F6UUL5_9BACT|nr:MAG: hypothetical protein A2814_02045 [Candidatus Nomurabacteria bacterium RIFCSPHIGHO2_01_FULL_38_19]